MGHPSWPIFDVEIRTPSLVLRAVDDELAGALADLAARGVHDPDFAPFLTPWTDLPSPELERGAPALVDRPQASR